MQVLKLKEKKRSRLNHFTRGGHSPPVVNIKSESQIPDDVRATSRIINICNRHLTTLTRGSFQNEGVLSLRRETREQGSSPFPKNLEQIH